jgi:AraC-like DNA-binding protein
VFCLIDAPSKEVVTELHNQAHGLVPHRIIEVQESVVQSFLGRVSDPENAEVNKEGLKLINDPPYRILLYVKLTDPVLLKCLQGKDIADRLCRKIRQILKDQISINDGMEVEHYGPDFIASFTSAEKASLAASNIKQQITGLHNTFVFRVALTGGEPVSNNEKLFGDVILLAERICFITKDRQIGYSSAVKHLVFKDSPENNEEQLMLSAADEILLTSLFNALEDNWQKDDFDMEEYCQHMAMSRSRLYRKSIALCGMSPNALLKEYRLEKGREFLKSKPLSVSQITFDAGFNSPSYFTRCFKKKYGILPMAYMDMVK